MATVPHVIGHRRRVAALGTAVVTVVLMATACSSGSDDGAPATGATPVVVPEALQFTAPLVGGGEFDGADVALKPTVFWFWAPT